MAFVGFDFNKMSCERKVGAKGKIHINNKVDITAVEAADLRLKNSPQGGVRFSFKYDSDYGRIGGISLEGTVTYITTSEEAKNIVDTWKEKKHLKTDLTEQLLNRVLKK